MCKNFVEHFKKYNQIYSFGLLLIITLLVAFLYLRIDALEIDIDRQVNEPNINHQLTLEKLKSQPDSATIKTEVTVSDQFVPEQQIPDTTLSDELGPTGDQPSGVVVPETQPGGTTEPDSAPSPGN